MVVVYLTNYVPDVSEFIYEFSRRREICICVKLTFLKYFTNTYFQRF